MLRHFRARSGFIKEKKIRLSFFFAAGLFSPLLIFPQVAKAQWIQNQDSKFSAQILTSDNGTDDNYGGYYVGGETDSARGQNPTAALFKSMFIPGWGQLGNKRYIKAGIIIALETTLIGTVVHYAKKTSDAREAFDNPSDSALIPALFTAFDNARDRRNYYSWLTGALIFISMFDAYVDAHLANFPKYDKNISLEIAPAGRDDIRAVLAYRF